jgi:hypothetical protein
MAVKPVPALRISAVGTDGRRIAIIRSIRIGRSICLRIVDEAPTYPRLARR